MNKLNIAVELEPCSIKTNFTDIEEEIKKWTEVYKELPVTEENKTTRKKDIATLRKYIKAFNERKSEVKGKCLAPYTVFENEVNKLINYINEPIRLIDYQVKEFEEKARQKKKLDIEAAFSELIQSHSQIMQEEVGLAAIYDSKWENVSVSIKTIKEEISSKLDAICDNVAAIKSMASDKTNEALELFFSDFDAGKAIRMINRYEAQKCEIQKREEERQRLERQKELELERERIRTEERQHLQDEISRKVEEDKKVELARQDAITEFVGSMIPDLCSEVTLYDYRIYLTEDAKEKLEMYLDSVGIEYEARS